MTTPQLTPYLFFEGNCREAITFYQACLGGELLIQTFGESPMADQMPEATRQQVMHSSLTNGMLTLFSSDAGAMGRTLVRGNSVRLCLNCTSREQITTLFAQLAEGGTVNDGLVETAWGATFGSLTDRFGVSWLLNYQHQAAQ